MVLDTELGIDLSNKKEAEYIIKDKLLNKPDYSKLYYIDHKNLKAPIASGSVDIDAMLVVPCSMGTLARIACGISGNLIERAADVSLKESRRLIIAPRETPFNQIHLQNMLSLSRMGAPIVPCMPAFYYRPQDITQLVDFVAGRLLDALGVKHKLYSAWSGS